MVEKFKKPNKAISEGIPFLIAYEDTNKSEINLMCKVIDLETNESIKNVKTNNLNYGFLKDEQIVSFTFETVGNIKISLSKTGQKEIFKKNFNFNDIGIGGLDSEFGKIFRRIFTSRLYPQQVLKKLGINHVRGMLL